MTFNKGQKKFLNQIAQHVLGRDATPEEVAEVENFNQVLILMDEYREDQRKKKAEAEVEQPPASAE